MTDDPDALAFAWLVVNRQRRIEAGLRRSVVPRRSDGTPMLDLAGNDYLGLGRHPTVLARAHRALDEWGAGATGSRLVTGTTALHAELEEALTEFLGASRALVFSSGYLANLGAVTALAPAGTLVVSDALNHASIVDACRLSRADVVITPHSDVAAVRAALAHRTQSRALVVTDAVFSVDGDLAPLGEMHAVARAHGAGLLIDEAHGLGVIGTGGRGAAYAAGLAGAPEVVLTVTLSKSLGSQGGAVVGSTEVVEHVLDTARSFIFDTALAPAAAGAALGALEVLRRTPALAEDVRARSRDLRDAARGHGLTVTDPMGAVTSVLIGDPVSAVSAAGVARDHGVLMGCFRPPSVPDGISRLRLTARADLSAADLALADDTLAAVAKHLAVGAP